MYGPLITFEIKVNPITHGGTGRVNPMPNGASVWNGPPYQENCLFVWIFAKLSSQVPVSFALATFTKTLFLCLLY